jgi:hypothetical protein
MAAVTPLTRLNLANCDVHGPGLEHIAGLIRLAELKSLKTLRLTRSKQANLQSWTDTAIEQLRTTRPDLTLDVK